MLNEGTKRFISRHKDTLLSMLLCTVVLIIALLLHPIYETNDDPAMEALLFGVSGSGGTSFLVFINRVLGCILKFLVSVFPKVNWFFIMHYSICLVSIFVLARTFIGRFPKYGLLISIAVVSAAMETLYLVQFTKTASIASIAGIVGLIFALKEERNSKGMIGICTGLILFGSMVRYESLLMLCPILFFVYLFELIEVVKNQKEKLKGFIVIPVITICAVLLLNLIGTLINNNTPGSEEYYKYNTYRSLLVDYRYDYYEEDSSYSELLMASNWMHNDPEVFTPDKLEELNNKVATDSESLSLKSMTEIFAGDFSEALMVEPLLILSLATTLIILLFSKKKLYVLPLLGGYVFVQFYLIRNGRHSLHRVDFSIYSALWISLLYLGKVSITVSKEIVKKISDYIVIPFLTIASVFIACCYPITGLFTEKEFQTNKNEFLSDAISQGNGYQYMVHPLVTGKDVTRNIFEVPESGDMDGCFYMGGWTVGIDIPGLEGTSNCDISGNPWKECIDSDTIRLVMPIKNGPVYMKIISLYIKDHYDGNVVGIEEYRNEEVLVYRVVDNGV